MDIQFYDVKGNIIASITSTMDYRIGDRVAFNDQFYEVSDRLIELSSERRGEVLHLFLKKINVNVPELIDPIVTYYGNSSKDDEENPYANTVV